MRRGPWLLVVTVALGGCGRIGYGGADDAPTDARIDSGDDAAIDVPDVPACRFRSLAGGREHTCVVNELGQVYCWGWNGPGAVRPDSSDGGAFSRPAQVPLPSPVVQVAAGNQASCARAEDGRLWCWGADAGGASGSLGAVVPIDAGGAVHDIAVGRRFSCAVVGNDRHVACWGDNSYQQLGTAAAEQWTPGPVPGTAGTRAVRLGHKHVCTLGTSGEARCWGRNGDGQLGLDMTSYIEPPTVNPRLAGYDDLALGGRFSCGIHTGSLSCWGANDRLQLGAAGGPVLVPGTVIAQDMRSVVTGARSVCGLGSDGRVRCWGLNREGELGTGDLAPRDTPSQVPGLTDVVALAAGGHHVCAEHAGQLSCWGENTVGALGRGTRSIRLVPVRVAPGATAYARLAVSGQTVCAVATAGGALSCWGENDLGQAGAGTQVGATAPQTIVASGVTDVALAFSHGCARDATGVLCWGQNGSGQLGLDTGGQPRLTPTRVLTDPAVTAITAASWHTCAIASGVLQCWGDNGAGQLGDGTTTGRHTPRSPTGLSAAIAVSTGVNHTCAIDPQQRLWCWGENWRGALGDGTTTSRLAPVEVSGGRRYTAVVVGREHTCALDTGGVILCWGHGDSGQLGSEVSGSQTEPLPVALLPSGLPAVASIHPRLDGACAVFVDGQGLCWGEGSDGALGNGAERGSVIPVPFGTVTDIAAFAGTQGSLCALRQNGELWCAGAGGRGLYADAPGFTPATVDVPCR